MDWLQQRYWNLWHKIGGRPWTGIWRDSWVRYQWLHQMLWFFTGIGVYRHLGWLGVGIFVGIYTYGYLQGHFCWQDKFLYKRVDGG